MKRYPKLGDPDDVFAVKEFLSMKPKWTPFSSYQQVAGVGQLQKGPPHGCGKKKVL
jgi:hypothetical protein